MKQYETDTEVLEQEKRMEVFMDKIHTESEYPIDTI